MFVPTLALLAAIAQPSSSAAAPAACVRQPLPPAIDSAGQPDYASDLIEFAATPSLDATGRSWVIRVSRRYQHAAGIEIIRLRRQVDCNRYDIENRWAAPLRQGEYEALAIRLAPLIAPPPALFDPAGLPPASEMVLDGTGVTVRFRREDWKVSRSLNHYTSVGGQLSAIFQGLAARYVPANELPTADWRTPRSTAK